MWLYALVHGVVSPVMVGRLSPSVCTADKHGMPSWGGVCRVNTDWTAPENMFSVTVLLPPPPQFILTMEVAAPENVYVEVATPKQVHVYIRLRQEVEMST